MDAHTHTKPRTSKHPEIPRGSRSEIALAYGQRAALQLQRLVEESPPDPQVAAQSGGADDDFDDDENVGIDHNVR